MKLSGRDDMVREFCGISGAVFLAIAALSGSAVAGPVVPVQIVKHLGSDAQQASFWGLPYPYGYSYRGGYARKVYHRRALRVRG